MDSSNDKILMTGGAGFIGTHISERLCRQHRIVIFDNLRRDSLSELHALKNHPNVEFVHGDVLAQESVLEAMRGCPLIIHLASIAGVSTYYEQPDETLRVNLIGTVNVLECCRELNIKKLIHFSTSEVYGTDAFDVDEGSTHCIGPVHDFRWTYAVSKLAGEQLALRYGEKYGFTAFTVRPFNIYGPRQKGESAISNFFRAVIRKEPITIYGDGTAIRSWCYISDFVDALQHLVEDERIESGTFNIGNPRATYSTLGLARLICQIAEQDTPIVFKDVKRTEVRVRVPNIDKARALLDFKPKVDLAEGLKLTYEYYREAPST